MDNLHMAFLTLRFQDSMAGSMGGSLAWKGWKNFETSVRKNFSREHVFSFQTPSCGEYGRGKVVAEAHLFCSLGSHSVELIRFRKVVISDLSPNSRIS